jgi:uncharacterized BrkB/YihY/UPF0761 family membrane protein
MLRVFQWIVRFFEWLRALDDRLEAIWLNKGWPDFLKWWFGGSLAIALFALLLVCIPGTVLLELNRLYQLLRTGAHPAGAVMYAGLWSFAVAFATVALAIAFVSCPLFMLQMHKREK